ncbi:amylo-alpha-1,6-glucosidase [Noviherbaspirillum cavernae]|uniref:Amylo-alpha-1,6-glucosidase n=1 Tax=Noviherbaspirillum cavernae TaxID=2320862 RepID=A0A418WZR2_9BURK|nr:glycogen debranching N-terminal domain-containing protein [Noviherbaspirillum cavernae]RJG05740.1 amylo-alpha-1,6-glucosidase [Noviherbaspirillum cavernae]
MPSDVVSILDGNTFVVSDRRGDLDATPAVNHGLFMNDTRFLSQWILTIDGKQPAVLSYDDLHYFRAQCFMALTSGTIYVDSKLSVQRRRTVNMGFREDLTLDNHAHEAVEVEVRLQAAADFADLFEVKDKLEKKGEFYRQIDKDRLVLGYRRQTFRRETWISATQPAQIADDGLMFRVRIPAKSRWTTSIDVVAVIHSALRDAQAYVDYMLDKDGLESRMEMSVNDWMASAPQLTCSHDALEATYRKSLVDLAALRFRNRLVPDPLPAAGLPWFMTIFGRDSLITSFQALPFVPQLARATLKTLSLLQARLDDPFRDAEPGKILHELRFGEMTAFEERPHSPYYGSADATPLFLVLLEEYVRWTGDREFAKELEREARAAVDWIDRYGDRDGDGYVEYERRNVVTGLVNQCWKDSWDSIAFADGTIAPTPCATCEIQGYVYDAKRRTAVLAREVWGDHAWAERLDREADELKTRFNRDFWIADRGFFALALDGSKRQVDSLTSNIGHLLWSGIADIDKAAHCVQHLMSDALFSGWGVRTMAETEASYNPIGYHVGTVWPHDTSLIAWGLRRYGYRAEAARCAFAMLEAAELFHHRLPEAFAGYPRAMTKYPVEYPTACSPQAWATGAPLLLLRVLLGLESDGRHLIIDPAIPAQIERLELLDIHGCWGVMDAFGRGRIGGC